ncbi:15292_t:CDS:1 [Dentiscutata erythropus]|uniref:15292_t:CDS:1 n=1 Tax=Dentiscutata erythropus TaxID=1348616 RepID=A0A9N8ZZJ9_9GLOM|nr:15292_t:CDS:1 [Dentiscutata erythropus]
MVTFTIEDAIKLVITKICTQMNINEDESEDVIKHISNDLSHEERTFFNDLTAKLNSHERQDDYNINNGCDFTTSLTAKIKDYIAEQSRIRYGDDSTNIFTLGGSFP